MKLSGKSFASIPVLLSVTAPVLSGTTAIASGWPKWLAALTFVMTAMLVAITFSRHKIARLLSPLFGEKLEHFLTDEHTPAMRQLYTTLLLGGSCLSLLCFFLGGGQWALAALTACCGGFFYYWGSKICSPNRFPNRASAGIALGAYAISLSANFIAGAAAGETTLGASLLALNNKTNSLLTMVTRVRNDTTEIKQRQQNQGQQLDRVESVLNSLDDKYLSLIEKHLADKVLGGNPTYQQVPPNVLAAAHELAKSKDSRARAAAAIVLRDWDKWRKELENLKSSSVVTEALAIKTIEGDGYSAQGLFDEAIGPYEAAFRLREDNLLARNNLAFALVQSRRGQKTDRLLRAIAICKQSLSFPSLTVEECASAQNTLGIALQNLPSGNTTDNLRAAIDAYTKALSSEDRQVRPLAWAMIHNNLGTAWQDLGWSNEPDSLRKSVTAFESALSVFTPQNAPDEWAMTQNNLGNTWLAIAMQGSAEHYSKAIYAYEQALTIRTLERAPFQWAGTQHNLGNAIAAMSNGKEVYLLQRAINIYEMALTVRTLDAAPYDWAKTQRNLAIARASLAQCPDETARRCEHLRIAISALKGALVVFASERTARNEVLGTAALINIYCAQYQQSACSTKQSDKSCDDIPRAR